MGLELRGRNRSIAHLTLRKDAEEYLSATKDEMLHDDGELYILEEVYGV